MRSFAMLRPAATIILCVAGLQAGHAQKLNRVPGLTPSLQAVTPAAAAQRNSREDARAREWKVPEIFQALGVKPGSRIADIGAGSGFLAVRLSPEVGPAGKVVAVDVDDRALRDLRSRVELAAITNIEIVRGAESDPLLAPDSLDGAVVMRAYHEFTHYREMLAKIRAALRPEGRLAILDVAPRSDDGSRQSQVGRHVLARDFAEKEVAQAGFRILRSSDRFATPSPGEVVWMIVAERPRAD